MAMTDKQRQARKDDFITNWYNTEVGTKTRPPKAFWDAYMRNDGAMGQAAAEQWIRNHDPGYLTSAKAKSRMEKYENLYERAFGFKIDWRQKDNKKHREAFGRANPRVPVAQRLAQIFKERIMTSKRFRTKEPSFSAWLNNPLNADSWGGGILRALSDYRTHEQSLIDEWSSKISGPMNEDLKNLALKNNWQPNNVDFIAAFYATPEYAGSKTYEDRAEEFDRQWDRVFAGKNVPVDEAQKVIYARNPNAQFGRYFQTDLKDTDVFKNAYPEYASWAENSGLAAGDEDIFTFIDKRREFLDLWAKDFTDGTLEMPPEMLAQALKENWSSIVMTNKIRALPQYKKTGVGKDRAGKFEQYWRTLFGENSIPDESLLSEYVAGEANDPSAMWDKIKLTDQFKSTYPSYGEFAGSQAAAGVVVSEDPASYNAYKKTMQDAFANLGMEVPSGLEGQIFASGIASRDVDERIGQYGAARDSYQLMTGEKADVRTVIGIDQSKTLAQAGALRDKLSKALEAHKAYTKSKFAAVENKTDNTTGLITQRI